LLLKKIENVSLRKEIINQKDVLFMETQNDLGNLPFAYVFQRLR
jgi:hypothetical protein